MQSYIYHPSLFTHEECDVIENTFFGNRFVRWLRYHTMFTPFFKLFSNGFETRNADFSFSTESCYDLLMKYIPDNASRKSLFKLIEEKLQKTNPEIFERYQIHDFLCMSDYLPGSYITSHKDTDSDDPKKSRLITIGYLNENYDGGNTMLELSRNTNVEIPVNKGAILIFEGSTIEHHCKIIHNGHKLIFVLIFVQK
jgi:hypothetical protein